MSTPLTLRPVAPSAPSPRHPPPQESAIRPWRFGYAESKDGHQANLLVLLHGLGDTEASFMALGKQFRLPGTCVLSLQAPFPVPLMDGPSYTWHPLSPSDFLSDALPQTSLESITTHTIPRLRNMLRYLVRTLGWPLERIHLFGWAQAGSVVLELARDVGIHGVARTEEGIDSTPAEAEAGKRLGSVTSICGPLLSTPALNTSLGIKTPVFYLTRTPKDPSAPLLRRTFIPDGITISQGPPKGGQGNAMPQGAEEWALVMRFWSTVLARPGDATWMRSAGGEDGEVYEVVR